MEKTNLNVTPYYDDFDETKDFHRVLFRPGFAVQARELTQLQSILQKQVERHGYHVFKEGTVVIPGTVSIDKEYVAVKLQSTISSTDISSQIQDYVGKKITGSTSGVVAQVVSVEAATTNDPITLYVKLLSTGTDNVSIVFQDGENISADGTVGSFGSGVDSATLLASNAIATGSSAYINEGVYFVRGHFVRVAEQRLILDKYTNTPSYRIGLTITESLETPEEDTSLLDNAQGTSNANAKGAHRLKFTLTLAKLPLESTDDQNFVELIRVTSGNVTRHVERTDLNILGETLARRTHDESGNYTIKNFAIDIKENLDDGLNDGVYLSGATTDSGNTAGENLLVVEISPGKAYVEGLELETIYPSFIDREKPRTYENYNGAITPVEVGNYVVINNINGSPEVSPFISGEIDEPYREIELYDQQTASRGTPSGTKIGFARARAFEHFENNTGTGTDLIVSSSAIDTTYKLYLFDIRMFTTLTMSGTPSPVMTQGAKVTGVTSGAYGYVVSSSSGTSVILTSVVGNFQSGEKIKSTSSTEPDEIIEDSGNTDLTISSISTNDISSVKQVYMNDPDTADPDFTGDVVLGSSITLTGLVTYSGTGTTIQGFQTDFVSELKVGDIVAFPSGASGALEERRITAVTDETTLSISSALSNGITSVEATRKRAQLTDQNKNILLRKLQKKVIKTLKTDNNSGISDSSVVIRRSFVDTSTAGGQVTFSAGANETFNAVDNTDYVLSIMAAGAGGSGAIGDIVNLNSSNVTVAGAGTSTLTITSSTILGNGAEVRLIATITRSVVNEKAKTRNRMRLTLVDNDGVAAGAEYGTSAHHKEISLGVADIHKLWAVYDSGDSSTNPTLPQWTITGATGTFTKGELITGSDSSAIARIVNPISPITYIPVNDIAFSASETITGSESGETATLDTFTEGSTNITSRFVLDTGQRDNFYDVGRIIRKSNEIEPSGKLLIVYDNFAHGTGDFFTVDSYSSIDYKEIPTYTATRVDPEVAEPTGEYELADTVDFRPRVADASSVTQTIQSQTAYKITSMSFNFEDRNFSGSGSSTSNIPKDNSNFSYDFDYYVGRIDTLYVTRDTDFLIASGAPSEIPEAPQDIDKAMKLATITYPPYVKNLSECTIERFNNRRYTMRDIGKLEQRINNLEYYTSLNLLEREAENIQIQDANGLDRFKSGFLVDNFAGHAVGNPLHPDYSCSVDFLNHELRPKYYMKGISLEEENLTDADRTNDNYQKTGDLLTLPYTSIVTSEQPYATRIENLNSLMFFSWTGVCKLTPSGDEWFEVKKLPALVINVEGNYDTVLAQNRNAIGTVWNAWQTTWSGTSSKTTRSGVYNIKTTTTTTRQQRTGVETSVVDQIDYQSLGDKLISTALIPFIRSRNVAFVATGMKPVTRVYPFFDKQNVGPYVTPTGGSLGSSLVTDAAGKISGIFQIPNPNVRTNPKFKVGDRVFKLTSSSTNSEENVETFAESIYRATGVLNTYQENIIATRNGRVQIRDTSQTRTLTSTSQTRTVAYRAGGYGYSNPYYNICFVAGTQVRMADGTDKNIEDVQIGEEVLGQDNAVNKVLGFDHNPLDGRALIGINGTGAFMTKDHPLMTRDGWKAYDSELVKQNKAELAHLMTNGNLTVGDEILTHSGSWVEVTSLEVFLDNPEQTVYNFELDGNNTYFADGLLAHNRGGGCFTAGTAVEMSDGSIKNIEDVELGESLLGQGGVSNKVVDLWRPVLGDRKLVSFNGNNAFVTDDHPVWTKDGWKSVNPEKSKEKYSFEVEKLQVGDQLLKSSGEWVKLETISISDAESELQLYNFGLDGNNTYFADGLLVHNKGGGGGGGGACCFVAGTPVIMSDGSTKKIEDVEIGDVVLGKDNYHNTVQGFIRPKLGKRKLMGVNGSGAIVTADHPLWTQDGWKAHDLETNRKLYPHLDMAGALEVGDKLLNSAGEWIEIESIETFAGDEELQVYNFSLDGNNTYFGYDILAHNKGDPMAQSFRISELVGGQFITKMDVFMQSKDEAIPMRAMIREMFNGFPTNKVLPFGDSTIPSYEDGTVSFSSANTTVTGSGTNFTEVLSVGQRIGISDLIGGNTVGYVNVASIVSDTEFTFDFPASGANSLSSLSQITSAGSGKKYSRICLSDDASQPTTVVFDSPIYIDENQEYCIVLYADSMNYNTWISRLGERDVLNNSVVSKQPTLGMIFKSQNDSTWSEYQMDDMKYTLYRAQFDTTVTGAITLNNAELPTVTLGTNPIRTISGETKVKVIHRDHHMYSTSNNVTISGASSGVTTTLNGTLAAAGTSLILTSSSGWPSSGTIYVKCEDEVMTGTISGVNITGLTRAVEGSDVEHTSGTAIELYQINDIPLTEINKTHTTLGDIQIDSYTLSTTTAASSSGESGGLNVVATENASMDVLQTLIPVVDFATTRLDTTIRTTSGTSPSGSETSFTKQTTAQAESILLNENYYFNNPKIICSQLNETNELSGEKSFNLTISISSSVDNLSPVIDLDRKTAVAVANRLDNIDSSSDVYPTTDFVLPTEPDGDSNEAVYITKKVQLQTPATAIKCFLDAVKFDSSEIQVMYKVLRSDDASEFDEIGWTYFNGDGSPDTLVNPSVNAEDFIERKYTVDGLQDFVSFAIKIRMQGTNTSEVPRMKRLRAIALAT